MSQPLRVDEFLQQLRKYENKEDFLSLMKIYEQKYYDQFESQANNNFPPELQRQSLPKQHTTYDNNKMIYQTYQKPPVQRSMSANKLEINDPQFPLFQRPSPRQEIPIDPFASQNAYNDPSRQQFLNIQQLNQIPQVFPSKPSPQPIFPSQPQFPQSIQKQEPIYQNQFQPQQPQYQAQLIAQQFPQTQPQYQQQKQFQGQGQFQQNPQFQSQPQQQQYPPQQLFQQNPQQLYQQQQQQQQLHQLTPGPQFLQGNIDQPQPQYSQQNKQQQMDAFLNEIKAQRMMKQQQYK